MLVEPSDHLPVIGQVLFAEQRELLQVVFRIQLVLVDRLLADDRVEEVAGLRHAAAGRHRRVALRVHVSIAVFVSRHIELAGHQHFGAVVHRERLPVGLLRAEDTLPSDTPITSMPSASRKRSSTSPSIWYGSMTLTR